MALLDGGLLVSLKWPSHSAASRTGKLPTGAAGL